MTKNELISKIKDGYDIMFDVREKHYTILTWTSEGIAIGEQYPNDNEIQYFKTAEELVSQFNVGDIPLAELASEIKITEYT